jgi:hypothetical protein
MSRNPHDECPENQWGYDGLDQAQEDRAQQLSVGYGSIVRFLAQKPQVIADLGSDQHSGQNPCRERAPQDRMSEESGNGASPQGQQYCAADGNSAVMTRCPEQRCRAGQYKEAC